MSGIPDPLRQLPDMHAVLDVAEAILTEPMTGDELSSYYRDMYAFSAPVSSAASAADASAAEVDPPGFTAAEQQASFDAFKAFAGGME